MVGHGGMIRSVSVSSDGGLVLTGSFDYTARLWRFDEQSALLSLDAHDGPVNAAVLTRNGQTAVTAGADGKVIIWSLDTGMPRRIISAHGGRAMALSLIGNDEFILSGGWDGRLVLWNSKSGKPIREINAGTPLLSVGHAADGGMLLAGGRDGSIFVFRGSDGERLAKITAHGFGLTQMITAPSGDKLLTIGLDNMARVWSLPTLALVTEFLPDPAIKPVSAAFSNDGRSMLIAYVDGTVLHLDTGNGQLIRALPKGKGPIWAVAFTPDGRFALTAGSEETVKVWHLQTGDRINVGAESGGRPTPWLESDHPGARLFRKCAGCHALTNTETQRSGPHFAGLFGRRAGSVPGYRYSQALRETELVWTRRTIHALFQRGPDRYLPGTKMPVQRIPDAASLDHLVDYLQRILPPG